MDLAHINVCIEHFSECVYNLWVVAAIGLTIVTGGRGVALDTDYTGYGFAVDPDGGKGQMTGSRPSSAKESDK